MSDDNRPELFLELDAFDPKWQEHYTSVFWAAQAADVMGLYSAWKRSPSGQRYAQLVYGLPDRLRDTEAERRLMAHALYNLDTIGKTCEPVPDSED